MSDKNPRFQDERPGPPEVRDSSGRKYLPYLRVGIMVASHNEDTVRYGVGRMAELGLDPQVHHTKSPSTYGSLFYPKCRY